MEVLLSVGIVLGGLGLFLYGMDQMSGSLKAAAGAGFRRVVGKATRNRWFGVLLGTGLGTLIRGTASALMTVGVTNAGLLSLAAAVPIVIGSNVGATLSMQLVSFKLTNLAYFAIGIGYLITVVRKDQPARNIGRFMLGFGLMFLGLQLMSDAIKPFRETLEPILARVDGSTLGGLLVGILIAAALTAVIQSSGAVIGMCFALLTGGALSGVEQAMPIVLGAHIGTCITAILGSIGTAPDARRVAFANLGFNLFNVAIAVAAAPLFLRAAKVSSQDAVRQTANLHTMVHVVAAVLALILLPLFLVGLKRLFRSATEPEASFLDDSLLGTPENALVAVLRELGRMARLCHRAYGITADTMFAPDRKLRRRIERLENISNETRAASQLYLNQLARTRLSRRQGIFIQHLDDAMIDLERVGDHIEKLNRVTHNNRLFRESEMSPMARELLEHLAAATSDLLSDLVHALDPDHADFTPVGAGLEQRVAAYKETAEEVNAWFANEMENKRMHPLAGLRYKDVLQLHDRMAKHIRTIAELLEDREFFVKRSKLASVRIELPVER